MLTELNHIDSLFENTQPLFVVTEHSLEGDLLSENRENSIQQSAFAQILKTKTICELNIKQLIVQRDLQHAKNGNLPLLFARISLLYNTTEKN